MSTVTQDFSIDQLFPEDIGKFVYYIDIIKEKGIIKSYDNQRKVAWVVFGHNKDQQNFCHYTANMCDYENLTPYHNFF